MKLIRSKEGRASKLCGGENERERPAHNLSLAIACLPNFTRRNQKL